MFLIEEIDQWVFQLALLGNDEARIAKLFGAIAKDAGGAQYDVLGTDGHRMRTLRYVTDYKVGVGDESLAINLASMASPAIRIRKQPISTGKLRALGLVVLGLDACIALGALTKPMRKAVGDVLVIELDEPTLPSLYDAIERAVFAIVKKAND